MPEIVDAFAQGVISMMMDPDPLFFFSHLYLFIHGFCYVFYVWGFRRTESISVLFFLWGCAPSAAAHISHFLPSDIMANSVNIIAWNVRGLGDASKRHAIFHYLAQFQIAILCLSETSI